MISFLRGEVIELNNEKITLDVGGVGYEIFCSLNTIKEISLASGISLFIQTHVREDAIVLFGFSTSVEKELFLSLIKVNGVGPKVAIKILSGATVNEFFDMIENEDVARLSKIPKVGKKTAEQLVLALRGKLVMSSQKSEVAAGVKHQIISALMNLGFKEIEVQKVVKELPDTVPFEEGLRTGLLSLGR